LSFKVLRDNDELSFYLSMVIFSLSLIFVNLILDTDNIHSNFSNFLHASFQTVSLLTGTGFTTTNYMSWPQMSIFVLLLAMFTGGCAGSTTGGIKMVRIMLLFKALKRELILVIHPRAVIKLRIGDKVLNEALFRNVGVFFFIFIILFLLGALVTLYLEGNNSNIGVIDGISVSLSCLANIGPGIGIIGPTETYGAFGDPTLLFLSFLMMLGRLEIITVLLLFFPDTYRD
jgi:trk system potassium uptake protein TrkH